jgi:hypothetical protein
VRLGRLVTAGEGLDDGAGEAGTEGRDGGSSSGDGASGSAALGSATLGSLADLDDAVVRVGGRLTAVEGRVLSLDDGTGRVLARLPAGTLAFDPPLGVGEVLNVSGRVRVRGTAIPEIVVRSQEDVLRAVALEMTTGDDAEAGSDGFLAGSIDDRSSADPGDAGASGPDHRGLPEGRPGPDLLLPAAAGGAALLMLTAALLVLAWPRLAVRLRSRGNVLGTPAS